LNSLNGQLFFSSNASYRNGSVTNNTSPKQLVFCDQEVQTLLRRLTGLNLDKIFRIKKLGHQVQKPVYQFMTEEELQEAKEKIRKRAVQKLSMPPVMEERNPLGRVLEKDEQLVGFDTCKYIFTDITYGVSDRSRLIVVRDPDGTLRKANWDEQDRLNEIYFPREGRKHYTPQALDPDHLETLLAPHKYEYILDRNCLQFEPDHPVYIRVAETVYQHIHDNRNFDSLQSTRHYGPMIFHLSWTKQLDEFIVYLIQNDRLNDAADAVRLHMKVNPDSQLNVEDITGCGVEEHIRLYAKYDSVKSGKVTVTLENLLERKENDKIINSASLGSQVSSK